MTPPTGINPHDIFAGLIAVILVAIVGYLEAIGETPGEAIVGGLGLALGYIFRGAGAKAA